MSTPDPKSELTEHDLDIRRQTLQEVLDNAPSQKDWWREYGRTVPENHVGYNKCIFDFKQIITNLMSK